MMLPSGNDAAHAIARALGGEPGDSPRRGRGSLRRPDEPTGHSMGLNDTNLVNPDGWGVPGHYSTAHDLAVFMMYALQYPTFVELISTLEYTTTTGAIPSQQQPPDDLGLRGARRRQDRLRQRLRLLPDRSRPPRRQHDDLGHAGRSRRPTTGTTTTASSSNYALDAKAEREANGDPIENPTLAYLDPDAAVISRTAIGGASVGAPLSRLPMRLSGRRQPVRSPKPNRPDRPTSRSPTRATLSAGRRVIGRLREHLGRPRCRGPGHRGAGLWHRTRPRFARCGVIAGDQEDAAGACFDGREASSPGPDRDRAGTKIVRTR